MSHLTPESVFSIARVKKFRSAYFQNVFFITFSADFQFLTLAVGCGRPSGNTTSGKLPVYFRFIGDFWPTPSQVLLTCIRYRSRNFWNASVCICFDFEKCVAPANVQRLTSKKSCSLYVLANIQLWLREMWFSLNISCQYTSFDFENCAFQ